MPEIGPLKIECASCGMPLEIPIIADLDYEDGQAFVTTNADVSGVWLHAWTEHAEEEASWYE